MQAVRSAVQAIRAGDGKVYLAGGVENMFQAPFLVRQMRRGHKLGDLVMIDSMVADGLTDPTRQYHMGITAENVAAKCQINRVVQGDFAFESHRRATNAQNSGASMRRLFRSPCRRVKGLVVTVQDEGVRADSTRESLTRLKPVFKPDGSVTAGYASSLNDGAALLLVCDAVCAEAHGLQPLAEIVSYACLGVDPALMRLGPSSAVPLAMSQAGLTLNDIVLIE